MVRRVSSSGGSSARRGSPRPLPVLRCLGRGLGSHSRRPSSLWLVVSLLFEVFHQPPGAPCSALCSARFSSFPSGLSSCGVLRQFHRRGLPQEARWHSVLDFERSRPVDSSPLRTPFCLASPPVHSEALNVLVDSLSRCSQVLVSEWTLCLEAFRDLHCRWPATIDLFATSLNHRLPVYFSPMISLQSAGMDAMLQLWDSLQAYAFSPFGLIPRVLAKVR